MPEVHIVVHKPDGVSKSPSSAKQTECTICFCNFEEEMKISECQHSFCKNCLQEYLRTEINSLSVLKIKCPEQTCPCLLNFTHLEEFLDSSDFERYQKLFLQKTANRGKDLICPQPGCSKTILPLKDSSSTKCNCGVVICNICGSLDHPNKSCIAALDPEFEAYAAENNLKMCLMCKTMISRAEGCLHITCSVCDYDWCWLCGREYHELHEAKCPRTWSPLPPKYIVKKDTDLAISKKIGMFFLTILKYAIYVLMIQTIFPYILFNVHIELRLPSRTRREKCRLVFFAIFIHLFYLFFVGLVTYLLLRYPQNRIALTFCLMLSLSIPWITKFIGFLMNGGHQKKRWKSRNVQDFHYTPANKPTENTEQDLQTRETEVQL